MRIARTIADLRAALAPARRSGATIGLVPTMGAFHDGHLALMRQARRDRDVVVVSLFVNPTQFNDAGDLAVYPRDEERDAELAREIGVDHLFAPDPAEVYPPGFATTVSVAGITDRLEGAHRGRAHFDGVVTVVTKLLNIVTPDAAYFGRKDAQQAIVVRRLVADLNLPVTIAICPTVRAADGLALSSRNALLSPGDRRRATALHRALRAVHDALIDGEDDVDAATATGLAVLAAEGIEPEYLAVVDPDTMEPLQRLHGDALVLVAAPVGPTRLIDNLPIRAGQQASAHDHHQVATPLGGAPTR